MGKAGTDATCSFPMLYVWWFDKTSLSKSTCILKKQFDVSHFAHALPQRASQKYTVHPPQRHHKFAPQCTHSSSEPANPRRDAQLIHCVQLRCLFAMKSEPFSHSLITCNFSASSPIVIVDVNIPAASDSDVLFVEGVCTDSAFITVTAPFGALTIENSSLERAAAPDADSFGTVSNSTCLSSF